jgi:hypothetical protein
MILVIPYGIIKITKSLGVEMSYSMRRSCTKISCEERNKKNKNQNTHCLMRSLKKKSKGTKKSKCSTIGATCTSNSGKCCSKIYQVK